MSGYDGWHSANGRDGINYKDRHVAIRANSAAPHTLNVTEDDMGQVQLVRAKFRCMDISRHWNGQSTKVRLLPVTAKNGAYADDPEASAENARFWQATPSGEATLFFPHLNEVPFELGECHYIDMQPAEESGGNYTLEQRTQHEHQLDVVLTENWRHTVKMSICNKDAWGLFGGQVGACWRVAFVKA